MANTETVCTPPTLYAKSKYFRAQDNVIKNIRLLLHIIICKADTKCILFTYGTKTQFHLQHPQHVAVERLYDMGNLPRLCSRSAKKLSVQLINCLLRKLQTNYNDQVQYNTFLFWWKDVIRILVLDTHTHTLQHWLISRCVGEIVTHTHRDLEVVLTERVYSEQCEQNKSIHWNGMATRFCCCVLLLLCCYLQKSCSKASTVG